MVTTAEPLSPVTPSENARPRIEMLETVLKGVRNTFFKMRETLKEMLETDYKNGE
jgi:hypothetical protein